MATFVATQVVFVGVSKREKPVYASRVFVYMESHVNQVPILCRVFIKIPWWLYDATRTGLKMIGNLVNSCIYPSHIYNDMHIATTI